jgi:RimJ/RimL family protein N-acetyltransferase
MGNPYVARFLYADGPPDRAMISARLQREITSQQEHAFQYWPIFLRSSGQHVGCCGLRPYKPGVPELGIHLLPEFWDQGLAVEAAQGVIRYAFDQPSIQALFAGHAPENHSSRKLLLKLGFQYTHDELYSPTGQLHPSYILYRTGSNGGNLLVVA